ncbi:MAG: hypothetical protein D6782_05430, partial [Alphaproteobacteria bacterium]
MKCDFKKYDFKPLSVAVCMALLATAPAAHAAAIVMKNINLALDPAQIEDNTFSNDVWRTPVLDVQMPGPVLLNTGDMLVVWIKFKDMMHVQLDDGFFNGDESVKIEVGGVGGVGGFPNNLFDWEITFTGVHGALLVNPVTGSGTMNALNGNASIDQDVDLINGGILQFHDIHLKLTNRNPNLWSIGSVQVGVDADDIT